MQRMQSDLEMRARQQIERLRGNEGDEVRGYDGEVVRKPKRFFGIW